MHLNRMIALSFACAVVSGCSSDPLVSSGYIELGLTAPGSGDAVIMVLPTNKDLKDVVSAVVEVDQVELEVLGKGWVGVLTSPVTVDLLKLDGKTITSLGVTKLPTGNIDDIRLRLNATNAFVQFKDGSKKPLTIPTDGILHINGTFDVEPCATGTVIIDFDPKLSCEGGSTHKEYKLAPIAKIKTVKQSGSCAPLDAGTKPDASKSDMSSNNCNGVICAPNEQCINNMCVPDPCFGVVCPPGEMCNPSTGTCQAPMPDMSSPPDMSKHDGGSNMDGGCKK